MKECDEIIAITRSITDTFVFSYFYKEIGFERDEMLDDIFNETVQSCHGKCTTFYSGYRKIIKGETIFDLLMYTISLKLLVNEQGSER